MATSKTACALSPRTTKAYTRAKTDRWEADFYCDKSKASTRRFAKKVLAKALRQTESAHIAESAAA
jgi:hypothetical protein